MILRWKQIVQGVALTLLLALLLLASPALTTRSQGGSITIVPPFPTTADDISIIVSGQWGTSCPKVIYSYVIVVNTIFIQGSITNAAPVCLFVITPWSITVKIGKLPAGTYIVNVNIQGGPWSVVGTKVFQVTGPPAPAICNPGPQMPGVYLATGGRFYATGADDKRDDWGGGWGGVDGFALITVPNVPTTWGAAYQASIWHSGDWVVYHFLTGGGPVGLIELCLSNYLTPPTGTRVEVYVRNGAPTPPYLPPEHDKDLAWQLVGPVDILPPGLWQIYPVTITTPIPPATEYAVALKCPNCELEGGFDRNVDIAWVKLVELAR